MVTDSSKSSISEAISKSYEFELTRKEQLFTKVSMPLAIFTVLGGVFAYYVNGLIAEGAKPNVVLAINLLLFGGCLLLSVYNIFRSLLGRRYQALPRGDFLKQWVLELETHYQDDASKVDAAFNEGMEVRMLDAISVNGQANESISAYLHRANIALCLSGFFALVSSVPFYICLHLN